MSTATAKIDQLANAVEERIHEGTSRLGDILNGKNYNDEACTLVSDLLGKAWAILCDGADLRIAVDLLDLADTAFEVCVNK